MKILPGIIILMFIFTIGCAGVPADTANIEEHTEQEKMETGKKILVVIAPEGFRDEEFLRPKEVFENAGIDVVVASKEVSVAQGKLGASVDVDVDITKVVVLDFDAVVFIGGPGTTVYFDDPVTLQIAKDADSSGKIVAAICIAPSILANAGVLEDHRATSFVSESENVGSKSAGYTGDDVTVDGNIVTANGPEAARRFGEEIVQLIDGGK